MAVQRHSFRCPRSGTPTRCCQEPQEPLIALIQSLPACGCKAMLRVAIPSRSKRALCHRRRGEHFYEHEHQRKMFGCSANEHEHHPLGMFVNTTIERYLASP